MLDTKPLKDLAKAATQPSPWALCYDEQERWFFGPIGYVLRDVIALPIPVPLRGWQGFWKLPHDVTAQIEEQLDGR